MVLRVAIDRSAPEGDLCLAVSRFVMICEVAVGVGILALAWRFGVTENLRSRR